MKVKYNQMEAEGTQEECEHFAQTIWQPSTSTPSMQDAIHGWVIIAVGVFTIICMALTVSLPFDWAPFTFNIASIIGIGSTGILLQCKYNVLKTTIAVMVTLIIIYALILGYVTIKELSSKSVDKAIEMLAE